MSAESLVTNYSQFAQSKLYLVPTAADRLLSFKTATTMGAMLGDATQTPTVAGQIERVVVSLAENTDAVIRLAKDETRNEVVRHATAKELAERVSAIVRVTRDNIARTADDMQHDAMAEIDSVLGSKDPALSREIRDWMRSTLAAGGEKAMALVSSVIKRDVEAARAVYSAGFFLTGMSEALHANVRTNAVKQFCPGASEKLVEAQSIKAKLPNWDRLPAQVHAAYYLPQLADRASTRVEI